MVDFINLRVTWDIARLSPHEDVHNKEPKLSVVNIKSLVSFSFLNGC